MTKKHVMAISYQPKIEPVKDGRCTQTIRKGHRVDVGDEILFHGWVGRPYRSKWNWRLRVVVKESIRILISNTGISFPDKVIKIMWSDHECAWLAALDFIEPSTGPALRDVLFKLNGGKPPAESEVHLYQIIRW
ncbi:MAG: hypothetical protein ABIG42_07465 [bacterium]